MKSDLITQAETAAILGVERGTIWRWQKRGKITPALRVGNVTLYEKQYVLNLDPDKLRERRASAREIAA